MREQFKKISENIRLTSSQEEDAQTKYSNVCEIVHDNYYDRNYDGSTKFLFGSYKTKTNIRPLSTDQDVDVLLKLPAETFERFDGYESNGQAALLQEVRECLKDNYNTTELPKAWGKVVLVSTSEGHHNVELLPAFEQVDGRFLIPNSENGGSWDYFNPQNELVSFHGSNNRTDGLMAHLARMAKSWVKNTSSLDFKSYILLNKVTDFLMLNYSTGAKFDDFHLVIRDLFNYLTINCDAGLLSHVQTAYSRSEKAVDYFENDKPKEASEEYRKIFGNKFPLASNPIKTQARVFTAPSRPYGNN